MSKIHEYAISFKDSRQISQDHWEVYTPTKKINDQTTIGEIRQWFSEYVVYEKRKTDDFVMSNLMINELE